MKAFPRWLLYAGAGVGLGVVASRVVTHRPELRPAPASGGIDDYAPHEPTPAGACDPTAKPGALAFRDWIIRTWGERPGAPQNIVRDCSVGSPSEHWEGRAWDWMIPSPETAGKMVDWLLAPCPRSGEAHGLARRAGVMYLIWNRRMWRAYPWQGQGPGSWSPYGGASPHTDHVHVSFSWAGARAQTSLYPLLARGEA